MFTNIPERGIDHLLQRWDHNFRPQWNKWQKFKPSWYKDIFFLHLLWVFLIAYSLHEFLAENTPKIPVIVKYCSRNGQNFYMQLIFCEAFPVVKSGPVSEHDDRHDKYDHTNVWPQTVMQSPVKRDRTVPSLPLQICGLSTGDAFAS